MKACRLRLAWMAVVSLMMVGSLHAQEITGIWQGTLLFTNKLRVVVQIEKSDDGTLKGHGYSIDQSPNPIPLTMISYAGSTFRFTVDDMHASYGGTMSPDGKTITGVFKQDKATPLNFERATQETAWKIEAPAYKTQLVEVDKDVKLEVLDWGGTGRPLVLLTGLGDNAHTFDRFAPKLTDKCHVYGITRRGFGASSKPSPETASYSADRLGEDVLAVIAALHLERPVLAGHSVAGEELSYIGTRHPEMVAGLIYLDAGYPYALYDEVNGSLMIDAKTLREQLGLLQPGAPVSDPKKFIDEVYASLQRVEKEVARQREEYEEIPPPPPPPAGMKPPPAIPAIMGGTMRFTTVKAPVLAIFADPHNLGDIMKDNPKAKAALVASNNRSTEQQAVAFERQVPSAKVVRIPNASHAIFRSNETDVLREMNAFIATLP